MYQRICSECGCGLSDTAAVCPGCGAPVGAFCTECGRIVPFGAEACLNCGAPALTAPPVQAAEQDSAGRLLVTLALVFAFFLPPVGLVISIVGLKSKQIHSKRRLVVSLVISVILTAALTVFLSIFLPKAIKAYSTGKRISDFFKGLFGA